MFSANEDFMKIWFLAFFIAFSSVYAMSPEKEELDFIAFENDPTIYASLPESVKKELIGWMQYQLFEQARPLITNKWNYSDAELIERLNTLLKLPKFEPLFTQYPTYIGHVLRKWYKESYGHQGDWDTYSDPRMWNTLLLFDAPAVVNWFKIESVRNPLFKQQLKDFVISVLNRSIFSSHSYDHLIIKALKAGLIDPHITDAKGQTALMLAVAANLEDIVQLLLDAGADVTIVLHPNPLNKSQYISALSIARQKGNQRIIKILEHAEHVATAQESFEQMRQAPSRQYYSLPRELHEEIIKYIRDKSY